jgi:hypothetical protein
MSRFNPRRFTELGALRRFHPQQLLRFLEPYRDYLTARGIALPRGGRASINYETLSHVLMTPNKDTPHDLVDALYFVHEMATQRGMDVLLEEVRRNQIHVRVGPKSTPADVALELWLARPELVQRKHAEQRLAGRRNFESFRGSRATSAAIRRGPNHSQIGALEEDLRTWFEQNLRGRWCRVTPYHDGPRTVYMVRHGDAMHREPSVAEDRPSVALYRPELFDVLAYNLPRDELGINADDSVRDEYRRCFGARLFGDADYFPASVRFTLEPLRRKGRPAIVCTDVPGIERVHLIEIKYCWPGADQETTIRRAPDLFSIFEKHMPIPTSVKLVSAKFNILFSDSKKWRTVRVEVPNRAEYRRDEDARLVETWLRKRDFIMTWRDRGRSDDRILESSREASLPISS